MASGIVTGCGKGIGLATAARLLRQGDHVVGISRSVTPGIHGLMRKFNHRFQFLKCDISRIDDLSKSIEDAISLLPNVDYTVANAGIRSRCSFKDSSLDLYSKVFGVNTLSQIHLTKLLVENALINKSPLKLLYLTSIVGPAGFSELSTYACSKSALEGFVRSLAIEYARDKILINCVAPGFIKSSYYSSFKNNQPQLHSWTLDRTPMGRWGTCHEVAKLISFLISSDNSYMTGATVFCDGGWSAA